MKKQNASIFTERMPMMILSDGHLGMTNYATGLLVECLDNTECDVLVINGDFIDGWRLKNRHARDFPEQHKRVVDAINRKRAQGTRVIFMPGNHDAELRHMDLFGKEIMGIRFENSIDMIDPKGRHIFIAHGDQFDEGVVSYPTNRIHNDILDYGYVAANAISSIIDNIADKTIGRRFNLVSNIRTRIEKYMGKVDRYANGAIKYAREHGFDGIIAGHFHMPDMRESNDGIFYANSGDWIENHTGLVLTKGGDWKKFSWLEERRKLGIKGCFNSASSPNPNAAYRPLTEKMVAEIHRIWPGYVGKRPPVSHSH